MAVINDLPYELVNQIVSYLPFSDLLNSNLISPGFHAVAQPLLFRACRVVTNTGTPNGIKSFLCALLAPGNESLATSVLSLTISCSVAPSTGGFTGDQMLRLARRGVPVAQAGIGNQYTPQETLVIILIHLLTRVKLLNIGKLRISDRFHQLLETHYPVVPTELPAAFQSITEFRCTRRHPIGGMTARALLMLLDLPLLTTVKVHIIEELLGDAIESPATSKVTSLSLSYYMTRFRSLHRILSRITALERLSYRVANTIVLGHCSRLGVDLRLQMNTLCYLRLDCSSLTDTALVGGGASTIGSLRDWPLLRTLITSMLPLLGTGIQQPAPRLVDVLPRGIRKLEILRDLYWSQADGVMALRDALAMKETMLPDLEMVSVNPVPGLMSVARTYLNLSCVRANVVLAVDTSAW